MPRSTSEGDFLSALKRPAAAAAQSVLRYSITAIRSDSDKSSPKVCPPLPRPGCVVSYTLRRSISGQAGIRRIRRLWNFNPTCADHTPERQRGSCG